jgi:hypothetical protein
VALEDATRSIRCRIASALGLAPIKALEGSFLAIGLSKKDNKLIQNKTVLQICSYFSINVGKPSVGITFSQQALENHSSFSS